MVRTNGFQPLNQGSIPCSATTKSPDFASGFFRGFAPREFPCLPVRSFSEDGSATNKSITVNRGVFVSVSNYFYFFSPANRQVVVNLYPLIYHR